MQALQYPVQLPIPSLLRRPPAMADVIQHVSAAWNLAQPLPLQVYEHGRRMPRAVSIAPAHCKRSQVVVTALAWQGREHAQQLQD